MKWSPTELFRDPDQHVIGELRYGSKMALLSSYRTELLVLVAMVSEKVLSPRGASP
jgi:hypothetical protein